MNKAQTTPNSNLSMMIPATSSISKATTFKANNKDIEIQTALGPSEGEKAFYAVNFVKPSKNPYKAINHLGQSEIVVAIAS
jgi:hypothetical protein